MDLKERIDKIYKNTPLTVYTRKKSFFGNIEPIFNKMSHPLPNNITTEAIFNYLYISNSDCSYNLSKKDAYKEKNEADIIDEEYSGMNLESREVSPVLRNNLRFFTECNNTRGYIVLQVFKENKKYRQIVISDLISLCSLRSLISEKHSKIQFFNIMDILFHDTKYELKPKINCIFFVEKCRVHNWNISLVDAIQKIPQYDFSSKNGKGTYNPNRFNDMLFFDGTYCFEIIVESYFYDKTGLERYFSITNQSIISKKCSFCRSRPGEIEVNDSYIIPRKHRFVCNECFEIFSQNDFIKRKNN